MKSLLIQPQTPRPAASLALRWAWIVFLLAAGAGWAQETVFAVSGQSKALENTDSFPRAAAMGSAFVGVADDASALFLNPAGLGFLNQGQLALNSDFWLVNTVEETLLLGLPPGKAGGWAAAVHYLDYGTFDGRDPSGAPTASYGADRLGLNAGWGMEVLGGLALGVAVKGDQTQLAGTTSTSLAVDLGALWRNLDGFGVGGSFNNIGLASPSGSSEAAVNLGASYRARLDADNSVLAAVSGTWEPNAVDYWHVGMEYGLDRVLFLRAGWEQPLSDSALSGLTGFTAGVGVDLAGFRFDYAFLPYGDLGASHRISLGYQLGQGAEGASSKAFPRTGKDRALPGAAPNSPAASSWPGQAALPGLPPLPALPGGPAASGAAPANATPEGPPRPLSLPGGRGDGFPSPPADSPGGAGPAAAGSPSTGSPAAKDSLVVQFDLPDNSAPSGAELEKEGRYQEALQTYRSALQQNPGDAAAWWAVGNLYRRFHQKAAAIQCFQQVLRLQPGNRQLADWLGQYELLNP